MILLRCIVTAYLCIFAFGYGYFRGLDELSSFQSWGIGFDDGWKAAKEFFECAGKPVSLEEVDELKED